MKTKTITQFIFFLGLFFLATVVTAQSSIRSKSASIESIPATTSPSNHIERSGESTCPSPTEGVLWQECFDGDFEGWTLKSVLGSLMWKFSPDGNVSGGVATPMNIILNSPTIDNGCMALDYDFQQTQGDPNNLPPFPYPDVITELISPNIDISGSSVPLGLEFYQLIRRLNATPNHYFSSFSISLDGGHTWGDSTDINPCIIVGEEILNNKKFFPLKNLIGKDSLRIKFTYAGDFYFWVLDDIAVIERPINDMQTNENFYAIPSNYETPLSQVEPIYFLADIENVGRTPQTGVELKVTIDKEQGDNDIEVFSTIESYGTIALDSLAENVIISEAFTPSEVGLYNGLYEVSADNEDLQPENNKRSFSFAVSDTTFAKESESIGGISPDGDNSYTFGNIFYVPNGENWYARYISFQFHEPENLAIANKSVNTMLYKWNGTGVDGSLLNEEHLELLSFNSYKFQGDEIGLITIPVDLDRETFELESGAYYIAAVKYQTNDNTSALISNSQSRNYGANFFLQDSLQMPRYVTALDVGNTGTFNLIGFGHKTVPVIRLHIGTNPNIDGPAILSSHETLTEDNLVHLYPNPSQHRIQVELDLTERSHKVVVKIFDTQGRLLMQQDYQNIQKETFNFNIKTLVTGAYFLQVLTDKGIRTERFIVK